MRKKDLSTPPTNEKELLEGFREDLLIGLRELESRRKEYLKGLKEVKQGISYMKAELKLLKKLRKR